MPILQAKEIDVGYPNKKILHDLCLTLPSKKITSIIGQNGCGKSTLLKALARLLPLQKGEVLLQDRPLKDWPPQELAQKMAVLGQQNQAPNELTIRELVHLGRSPYQNFLGQATPQDQKVVEWALEVTEIQEFAERKLWQLSGGQRQRAWLALTLAQESPLLLLDEPTTYLDIRCQISILNLLRKLHQEQEKTIIMVLHDLNQAISYSHHIVAMKEGEIVAQGPVKKVMTPQLVEEVFELPCEFITHNEQILCLPKNS